MGRGTGLSPVCDGMYVCVYILPFTNRPTDAVSHSQAQNKQLQDLVHSVVSSLYTNVSGGASPTGEASTSAMRHAVHHPPVEEGDWREVTRRCENNIYPGRHRPTICSCIHKN